MKNLVFIILMMASLSAMSQQNNISGNLFDDEGNPLLYATAVLLNPSDSTMAYYGITNSQGYFEIKNIQQGSYIFQTSFIGFQSYVKEIEIPLISGNNMNAIIMKPEKIDLSEVEVKAMKVPFVIKEDTIEYNAGSYKVKSDAVAEDLLEKLPGVQVDRAGNIKAQGEGVQQVLVDGKEFFSSDPQVATKNLPADAIDKVQVYNKKSDETELTGIDDGSYSKTINLILKDGKKSAVFGDVTAGAGTNDKYMAGAKAYRFTRKHQIAALGMLNNVNKYGFSFRDYLDFNGGLQSIMGGGGQLKIDSDENLPIDFGQTIDGLVTSGAGGANFTYEAKKDNRFNISYLGSGADKNLEQRTITNNFFDKGSYLRNDSLNRKTTNRAHRINFGWRNKIDSTQNLIINGGLNFTLGTSMGALNSMSRESNVLANELNSFTDNNASKYGSRLNATYLKKWNNEWKLLKLKADFSIQEDNSDNLWWNRTYFFGSADSSKYNGFQNNNNKLLQYSVSTSATRIIGKNWYGVPFIRSGGTQEIIQRRQGILPLSEVLIDSLSPDFTKQNYWLSSGFSLNRNTKKSQLSLTLGAENSVLTSSLKNENSLTNSRLYFTPQFSWRYEFSTGRQFMIDYFSSVNSPSANQLLPVVNNVNPLQLYFGNINLRPEYSHKMQLHWIFFDQFSLTSIFASLNSTFTNDKINWSRNIKPDLSEINTLINVDQDYRLEASLEFSTPIRKLGLDLNVSLDETWNQGISLVNEIENTNINYIHGINVKLNNRKTSKIDISLGGIFRITDANYSLQQSLNKVYFNTVAFSDIIYTPGENWHFSLTADLSRYDEESFGNAISIPLLRADITHYFLKDNRGVLSFQVFDILNKNTGIERISEMNYLMEKVSNTIGRYAMLSFKYRLNKFDNKPGFDIQMKGR